MGASEARELRDAMNKGRAVDMAFGLEEHQGKRELFANNKKAVAAIKEYAEEREGGTAGYKFKMLGITYTCNDRRATIANEGAWAKAHRRCHRIGLAMEKVKGRKKLIRTMVLPKVLWNAGWQRPAKQKMKTLSNAIEGCIRGRPPARLGKRSRYLAWAVTIGADVCPFYYAAQTALRLAERIAVAKADKAHKWTKKRDPLEWILNSWAWRRGHGPELITRDGVLLLGEDGVTVVNAVARRAWEEWLWAAESRTQREAVPLADIAHARPSIQGHKA